MRTVGPDIWAPNQMHWSQESQNREVNFCRFTEIQSSMIRDCWLNSILALFFNSFCVNGILKSTDHERNMRRLQGRYEIASEVRNWPRPRCGSQRMLICRQFSWTWEEGRKSALSPSVRIRLLLNTHMGAPAASQSSQGKPFQSRCEVSSKTSTEIHHFWLIGKGLDLSFYNLLHFQCRCIGKWMLCWSVVIAFVLQVKGKNLSKACLIFVSYTCECFFSSPFWSYPLCSLHLYTVS